MVFGTPAVNGTGSEVVPPPPLSNQSSAIKTPSIYILVPSSPVAKNDISCVILLIIYPVNLTITSSAGPPRTLPDPHWKSMLGTFVVSTGEAPWGI